jgi:hypothetical protein
MHVHHFAHCKCGEVSVDGGQDYFKRVGSGWEEMGITIDKDALDVIVKEVDKAMTTSRNPLGVALAALRGIREAKVSQTKGSHGITVWGVK